MARCKRYMGAVLAAWPRQHGAWSVLICSAAAGMAAAGGVGAEGVLFLTAVACAFVGRHALSKFLTLPRSDARKRAAWRWAVFYLVIAAAAGGFVVVRYGRWFLLPWSFLAGAFAAAALWLENRRWDRTAGGEWTMMAGLAVVAPGTAYAVAGEWRPDFWGLAALYVLFFGGSVFYVRYVLRGKNKCTLSLGERFAAARFLIGYYAAAVVVAATVAALGFLPGYAVFGLAPAAGRAFFAPFAAPKGKPSVRAVGFGELFYTLIFVIITAWAFRKA